MNREQLVCALSDRFPFLASFVASEHSKVWKDALDELSELIEAASVTYIASDPARALVAVPSYQHEQAILLHVWPRPRPEILPPDHITDPWGCALAASGGSRLLCDVGLKGPGTQGIWMWTGRVHYPTAQAAGQPLNTGDGAPIWKGQWFEAIDKEVHDFINRKCT